MQKTIAKDQEPSTNISLDDEVLKIFAKMPDALKIEVLHYAEYLLNKGIEKSSIVNNDVPKKKYRQAGKMAGLIVMLDDFDEPLAEMKSICIKSYAFRYAYSTLVSQCLIFSIYPL